MAGDTGLQLVPVPSTAKALHDLSYPPEGGRAVRSLTSYVLAQWNRMVRASKNKFIARLAIDSVSMGLVQPLRAVHRARRGHPHPP